MIGQLNNQAVQESNAAEFWGTATNVLMGVVIVSAIVVAVIATGGVAGIALATGASIATVSGVFATAVVIGGTTGYASQLTSSVSDAHLANQTNINTAVNALQNNKTGEVAVSAGKMYTPGSAGYSLAQPALASVFSAIVGP